MFQRASVLVAFITITFAGCYGTLKLDTRSARRASASPAAQPAPSTQSSEVPSTGRPTATAQATTPEPTHPTESQQGTQPAAILPEPEPEFEGQPDFRLGQTELDNIVNERTADHRRIKRSVGRLDAFAPIQFRAKRNRCYAVVIRLEDGSDYSPHAKRGLDYILHEGDGSRASIGAGQTGVGAVASSCSVHAGRAKLDIQALWNSRNSSSQVGNLGNGSFTVEIYERTQSRRERTERQRTARESRRSLEEAGRSVRQRACEACRGHSDRRACLERRGLPMSTCGW